MDHGGTMMPRRVVVLGRTSTGVVERACACGVPVSSLGIMLRA